MKRFLVAGCGYIGSRVAKKLSFSGAEVFAITRTSTDFPEGTTGINAELGSGNLKSPGKLDGVVYCVAAASGDEPAYRKAYVDGLKEVIEKCPAKDFVFISSTAVYPRSSTGIITEESATAPDSFRGEVLLEAESILDSAIIARAGGIYGPGRMRYLNETDTSKFQTTVHRIHAEDLANFCSTSLLTDTISNGIYNLIDSKPSTGAEVIDWLNNNLQKDYPKPERVISNKKLLEHFSLLYPDYTYGYGEVSRR